MSLLLSFNLIYLFLARNLFVFSVQFQLCYLCIVAINPQTGQLDYSAAWAEYYRQQGMHYQAQAIMSGAPGGGPQQPR